MSINLTHKHRFNIFFLVLVSLNQSSRRDLDFSTPQPPISRDEPLIGHESVADDWLDPTPVERAAGRSSPIVSNQDAF